MRNSRIAEVTATSEISFNEALRQGVEKAAETLDNIESAFVKEQMVELVDGKLSTYRVNLLISYRTSALENHPEALVADR